MTTGVHVVTSDMRSTPLYHGVISEVHGLSVFEIMCEWKTRKAKTVAGSGSTSVQPKAPRRWPLTRCRSSFLVRKYGFIGQLIKVL